MDKTVFAQSFEQDIAPRFLRKVDARHNKWFHNIKIFLKIPVFYNMSCRSWLMRICTEQIFLRPKLSVPSEAQYMISVISSANSVASAKSKFSWTQQKWNLRVSLARSQKWRKMIILWLHDQSLATEGELLSWQKSKHTYGKQWWFYGKWKYVYGKKWYSYGK